MRKIVIPTDFSENAINALHYAVELFKYEKCEFFLLHAYADEVYKEESLTNEQNENLKASIHSSSEKKLQETLEKIKKVSPNPRHTFNKLAIFGALVDEVNDLVNSQNADLCVMATRGITNDRKLSFGSNTLLVLKYVQCPVLSIPENFKYNVPEKILFPTNYLIPYQKRELKIISEIARTYGTEVHLLYISNFPVESYRQKDNQIFIKEQFLNIKYHCHQEPEADKISLITNFIEEKQIDLLVMVNSRHTYLEDILLQGTIEKISLYPKIPFLVLQNFNRECV